MTVDIHRIPAFNDNYIWVVANQETQQCFAVDPGDSAPVIACLKQIGMKLSAILVTHHHFDHIGGVAKLTEYYKCKVYSPDSAHISGTTHELGESDRITVAGVELEIFAVPGHTLDHIAYYAPALNDGPALFCGDTLFAGGCGRLFEGSPRQMLNSLTKIADLPPQTQLYCAHEYTLANLKFAIAVEPDNIILRHRLEAVEDQRDQGEATVPSNLAIELASNPFLRTNQDAVTAAAERRLGHPPANEVETFTAIRHWKDGF